MRRYATGLLTLALSAALLAIPMAAPAKAAGQGSTELEKSKKNRESRRVNDREPSSPSWPPPMSEDFDRKNTSSGGM